jgi:DNA mismatch endonuclease (patch repair protein)
MSALSIRARAPVASSPATRRVMQTVRRRDTQPEMALRSALHEAGLRFRKDFKPEPDLKCKADIVFPKKKVCIFVDGCFWNRCRQHFVLPKANSAWWKEKIQSTVDRDLNQTRLLRSRGWRVHRVWEHEIVGRRLDQVVALVLAKLITAKKRAYPTTR